MKENESVFHFFFNIVHCSQIIFVELIVIWFGGEMQVHRKNALLGMKFVHE